MSFDQIAALTIILVVGAFLVWDRFRFDLVAAAGLVVAVAVGIVPADKAFEGFSDDIVIIVGSALVVSAAVERSGIAQRYLVPQLNRLRYTSLQVALLTGVVALLSAFVKNIGALAIFLPIAFQLSRRTGVPVSRLLMPLSFASLIGGLMTLIGTSPNVIVARMREEIIGQPFGMFDFFPVGVLLAVVGVLFLTVGWRLLPQRDSGGVHGPFSVQDYTAEACMTKASPFVGKTVADLEAAAEGEVQVMAIIREGGRRYEPASHWTLYDDDMLVLQCDAGTLTELVRVAKLVVGGAAAARDAHKEESAIVEAVVTESSPMIGASTADLRLRDRFDLHLLAIRRRDRPIRVRLRRARIQVGDLLVLMGRDSQLPERLAELGCLPLAERPIQIKPLRSAWLPLIILMVALVLASTHVTSVAVAFFGAATAILLTGGLTLKQAYERVEWPILVLFGCLIPLSGALQDTGASELIASLLSAAAGSLSPLMSLGLVMLVAMAVTPFLNNAATVLVMAPIAVGMANLLGRSPDAFLMAVAVGSACDFLTPVGHQCNTLVMGPGGYRFGDYWKLGLPLSLLVLLIGTPAIHFLWGR